MWLLVNLTTTCSILYSKGCKNDNLHRLSLFMCLRHPYLVLFFYLVLLVDLICNLYEITFFLGKIIELHRFLRLASLANQYFRSYRFWTSDLIKNCIIFKKMKRQKATSQYFCSMLHSSRVMSFWKFIYSCHTLHIFSKKIQPCFTVYNLGSNYNLEVQKVVNSTTFHITTFHITTRQFGWLFQPLYVI